MTSALPVLMTVDEARGRAFYHLPLDGYGEWPNSDLELASPHFVLLLIADATASEVEAERAAARRAIRQGLVFVCAWGPGSEHTEDTFDWAFLELPDAEARPVLMTTQHSAESLDDAVEFFLDFAQPDDAYRATCRSWVIATVGPFGADSGGVDLVRRRLGPP